MTSMMKQIPEFKYEAEEFELWSSKGKGGDLIEYVDWSQAKRVKFPHLKPALEPVSGEEREG